jgi:hypothetical protein
VELPDGRAVELAGKGHIDPKTGDAVETPHTHWPKPASPPPYDQVPSGRFSVPSPSTLGDILDSIIQLKGSLVVPATPSLNAPPVKITVPFAPPAGFIPIVPPKPLPPGTVLG